MAFLTHGLHVTDKYLTGHSNCAQHAGFVGAARDGLVLVRAVDLWPSIAWRCLHVLHKGLDFLAACFGACVHGWDLVHSSHAIMVHGVREESHKLSGACFVCTSKVSRISRRQGLCGTPFVCGDSHALKTELQPSHTQPGSAARTCHHHHHPCCMHIHLLVFHHPLMSTS